MLRTQIYLPEYEYKRLKEKAKKSNKTFAEVVRELIVLGTLKENEKKSRFKRSGKKPLSGGEFLLSLARLGEKLRVDAGPNASVSIDETLYGFKKK